MQFSSFSEFIAMGNHGFYVWLSYGFSFLILAMLIISSITTHRAVKTRIIKKQQRDEKLKAAQIKANETQNTILENN